MITLPIQEIAVEFVYSRQEKIKKTFSLKNDKGKLLVEVIIFTFVDRAATVDVPTASNIACENIRFSSLFVAGDVSRGGTSATQEQKFHTDDANQRLHNKSGSHGVLNLNLSNFACLLVDFG